MGEGRTHGQHEETHHGEEGDGDPDGGTGEELHAAILAKGKTREDPVG
jgi:hypothetical protein